PVERGLAVQRGADIAEPEAEAQWHRDSLAVEREFAIGDEAIIGRLEAFRRVACFRCCRDIEELGAAQRVVALAVGAVHAAELDADIEAGAVQRRRVEADVGGELSEPALEGLALRAAGETKRGAMLLFPVRCHGYAANSQKRQQQCGGQFHDGSSMSVFLGRRAGSGSMRRSVSSRWP